MAAAAAATQASALIVALLVVMSPVACRAQAPPPNPLSALGACAARCSTDVTNCMVRCPVAGLNGPVCYTQCAVNEVRCLGSCVGVPLEALMTQMKN